MTKSKKNQFWLVSRVDGEIQKYRLRMDRISLIVFFALSTLLGIAFVAGVDYGKGVTWIKGQFSQKARESELHAKRIRLVHSSLKQKAKALSTKERELQKYNQDLVKRISLSQSRLSQGLSPDHSVDPRLLDLLGDYAQTIKYIPIGSPVNYSHISSGFGYRSAPFSGSRKLHTGIDLSAKYGSHVKATAAGIVKSVRKMSGYGLLVDVEHGPGVVTRYAHLSAAMVKTGQLVIRGEVLGLVGMTGRSTGPHLHYELRIAGKPRSPHVLLEMFERFKSEVLTASLPLA
mgnify:CR=1 FL=1